MYCKHSKYYPLNLKFQQYTHPFASIYNYYSSLNKSKENEHRRILCHSAVIQDTNNANLLITLKLKIQFNQIKIL
jgi:hypothetical protein